MGSKAPPREKVTVRIASDSPCSRRFDSYPPATLPEVLPLSGPGCKARALAHFRSFVRQEANAYSTLPLIRMESKTNGAP